MLDKTKIYDAYNLGNTTMRKNVKILYEDAIGYFVESLIQFDSLKNGIRWSIKKQWYKLVEIQVPGKSDVCKGCPWQRIVNGLYQDELRQ